MFTLILLTIIFIFFKGLNFLYLFQIKEYRLDRFMSHLREYGLWEVFYASKNRMPARSLRNISIIIFLIGIDVTLFLLALENNIIYFLMTIALPFSPSVAFGIITVAVYLTEIPVQIYRNLLVYRAYLKVKQSKTTFIGITGSYGKTTVKEYLYHVLSAQFQVAKTEKNMNTNVGIALSLLKNLKKNTDIFITEVGAYRKGEIKNATWYVPFTYGILTGLGNQHVDLYGSREILIEEESSLLYALPENGTAYINTYIPEKERIVTSLKSKAVTYGFKQTSIHAHITHRTPTSTQAHISYKGYQFTIRLHLLGEHSLLNVLPVIAIALDLGMKPHEITTQIATLTPVRGKLSLHEGKAKCIVIDDSANSNVNGFIAAIQTLGFFPQKTKYIVSQGIIELGVEKRSSYQEILEELYKTDSKLLTTDVLFGELDTKDRVMIFNDVSTLQERIGSFMHKHSIILLEGKFPEPFIKKIFV